MAHVEAHRFLDAGQHLAGWHALGRRLRGHRAAGCRAVHLHWHMLVFELAVGRWHDAHARCVTDLLPAIDRGEADTDGPSALWRLWAAADHDVVLPWARVRDHALRGPSRPDPFGELHRVLALGGTADTSALDQWLRQHRPRTDADHVVSAFARVLALHGRGRGWSAATELRSLLPALRALGGSRGQQDLFVQLARRFAEPLRVAPAAKAA